MDDKHLPSAKRTRRAAAVEAIGSLYRTIAKTQAEIDGHKNGVPTDGPDVSAFGATFGGQQRHNSQPPNKENPQQPKTQQSKQEKDPGELPFGWAWARDDRGSIYYIDPYGRTTYKKPPAVQQQTYQQGAGEGAPRPLPDGWTWNRDPYGRIYFIDPRGQSTWQDPRL